MNIRKIISDDKTVLPSTDFSEDKTFITSEFLHILNDKSGV